MEDRHSLIPFFARNLLKPPDIIRQESVFPTNSTGRHLFFLYRMELYQFFQED